MLRDGDVWMPLLWLVRAVHSDRCRIGRLAFLVSSAASFAMRGFVWLFDRSDRLRSSLCLICVWLPLFLPWLFDVD